MIRPICAGITPPPAHGQAEPRDLIIVESSPTATISDQLQPVDPVRPAAGYIGGKRNLSRRLVALIGAVPHHTYAEAFVGMGGIFLRRDRRPRAEVINDWSEDVSTFFRILQRHYVAFLDMLRFQLTTRAGFERLMRTDPATLTDLERAARFLYLQRLAFGGKVAGRSFGVAPGGPGRFDVSKLGPLFYLDPPYFGCEDDYGQGMFARAEFMLMADYLANLRGRFILSLNDTPEVRQIFARFTIQEAETTYTLPGSDSAKKAAELIISGP